MGMFSWKTNDTDRSIANKHSDLDTFNVVMLDDKGNKWIETSYDGYGEFGGKDFYKLLAEMNKDLIKKNFIELRDAGIDLQFNCPKDKKHLIKWPNLVEYDYSSYINIEPESCEYQGFFYPNEDEDDGYCDNCGGELSNGYCSCEDETYDDYECDEDCEY